jgi:acylphosphatase
LKERSGSRAIHGTTGSALALGYTGSLIGDRTSKGGASMAAESNDAIERREVHFSGRVQGVGFRYTTRAIAARFEVTGFVQNLNDGRVLLVVEGDGETIGRFIDAVEAEMGRWISDARARVLPASREFSCFEVRH